LRLRPDILLAVLAAGLIALSGCGGGSDRKDSSSAATAGGKAAEAPKQRRVAELVAPANPPARKVTVPVLTYHRVNNLRPGANEIETDLTIEPEVFAQEMHALAQAGFHSITQQQLFDALYKGAALPSKPVLITVDDGYLDDLERILPVLQREGLKATFFVITGRFHVGGFMNENQVRQLDQAGMDIGDHTHTHVDLRLLDPAERSRQIAGSRAELEKVLGHPVYSFAYPFGKYDDNVVEAVRRAGFTFAYTTEGGTELNTRAPLLMPRLHVGRDETPSGLLSLVGG
jgi:peptidoglycan/xylan/chitin deacetylase (PgdA/CDA1 family)